MRRLLATIAVAGTLLAACGSTHSTATKAGGGTTTVAAAVTFPVTVTAANGPVTINARPQRILSLSPSATEMLYAIGAGAQVVGVDKYSTDPPNAPRTAFTGEEGVESYAPLHPDLVVMAFDNGNKLTGQLHTLGIPALLLPPATKLDDTYAQYRLLGTATGHPADAARQATLIASRLDAIVRKVGDRAKGLTYYHEVDNTLYTATSKTFIGSLYALLGMVNIADAADKAGSGYPQLSAEYLVKADPDFIFLADTQCCQQSAATVAARPGFGGLKAVRAGHVVGLPDPIASQWGPHVVDFLQDIADAVTRAPSTTTTA